MDEQGSQAWEVGGKDRVLVRRHRSEGSAEAVRPGGERKKLRCYGEDEDEEGRKGAQAGLSGLKELPVSWLREKPAGEEGSNEVMGVGGWLPLSTFFKSEAFSTNLKHNTC